MCQNFLTYIMYLYPFIDKVTRSQYRKLIFMEIFLGILIWSIDFIYVMWFIIFVSMSNLPMMIKFYPDIYRWVNISRWYPLYLCYLLLFWIIILVGLIPSLIDATF